MTSCSWFTAYLFLVLCATDGWRLEEGKIEGFDQGPWRCEILNPRLKICDRAHWLYNRAHWLYKRLKFSQFEYSKIGNVLQTLVQRLG